MSLPYRDKLTCPHCEYELPNITATVQCQKCGNSFAFRSKTMWRSVPIKDGKYIFRVGVDWPKKDPNVDYDCGGDAITLRPRDIGTHESGWSISGEIHEDYYMWVNDFEANHDKHGALTGNYQSYIYAESIEAFESFYKNHPPEWWDYGDI